MAGHTPIEVPDDPVRPVAAWRLVDVQPPHYLTVVDGVPIRVYISKRSPLGLVSRFARHSPDVARERFAFAHSRRFDAGEPPVVGSGDSVGPKHAVPVGQDPTEAAVAVGNRLV